MVLEYQYSPFSSPKALEIETLLGNLGLAQGNNVIDVSIRMTRVVMEEYQTFDMRLLRNLQGIEVSRMAPTEAMRRVFLWQVLNILNEEIRLVYQRRVARRFDQVTRRRSFAKGLVVGGVRQHLAIGGKTITQRTARMIEHPGFDRRTVGQFHHAPFPELHELDLRRHGMHRNREIRASHLARDDLFQGQVSMFGTQDGQLGASNIGGSKKGDALNMIPVRMAQEQVRVYRAWLRQQRLTQSPDARASVKDDERVVIEAHFDTGSIATVAHGGGPWCGYGPACP